MKKLFFALAVSSLFALAAFAQTPTPPASKPAAGAAPAAAAPAGGTGAEGKIATVRLDAFRQGITELKGKMDSLNTEFEAKRKQLESLQSEVENLKNKINTQGATVSAAVRNGWVEDGATKEKQLKRLDEDFQAEAQKRLNEVSAPVYDKIGKLLESYCQQRGIVLVIESGAGQQTGVMIFAAAATDITEDFMKEYNKANPAAATAAAPAAPAARKP